MNQNPLISIIVPVYNIDNFLSKCLESIINQTYRYLEVILIDDGSTDKSGQICDQYKLLDSRIKVYHKKNEGVSVARNLGLEQATGDYIGFVDGDDYISSDMYEFLLSLIMQHDADIASCSYYIVNDGRLSEGKGTNKEHVLDNKQGIIKCIKKQDFFGSIWTNLYKRSCISNLKFEPRLKRSEDYYFNFLAFCNSRKAVHQGIPKYYYVSRQDSATKDYVNLDTIFIARSILAVIKEKFPQLEPVAHYRDIVETISALYILEAFKGASIKTGYNKNDLLDYLEKYNGKTWSNPHVPRKYKYLLAAKRFNNFLFLKAISFYLNAKRNIYERNVTL